MCAHMRCFSSTLSPCRIRPGYRGCEQVHIRHYIIAKIILLSNVLTTGWSAAAGTFRISKRKLIARSTEQADGVDSAGTGEQIIRTSARAPEAIAKPRVRMDLSSVVQGSRVAYERELEGQIPSDNTCFRTEHIASFHTKSAVKVQQRTKGRAPDGLLSACVCR